MSRGTVVSYETVRRWCQKFGQSFADRRLGASVYRTARTEAFNIWQQENCVRHAS